MQLAEEDLPQVDPQEPVAAPVAKKRKGDPNIPEAQVQEILSPKLATPLAGPSFLMAFDDVLDTLEQASAVPISEEFAKISQFYLSSGQRQLHASKEAIAQLVDVPVKSLEPILCLLANTMCQLDKVEQAKLEQGLVGSGVKLIAYLEFCRFDETPEKMGHKAHAILTDHSGGTPEGGGSADSQAQASSEILARGAGVKTPAIVSKMFAVENKCVMLLKTDGSNDDTGDASDFVILTSTSLVPLRGLDRATGPCLRRCLAEASPTTAWSSTFPFKAERVEKGNCWSSCLLKRQQHQGSL